MANISAIAGKVNSSKTNNLKPRLVVMTDIGDCDVEPDDMESAIHLLAYADMFEIEAIMTSVGWNCDPYPEEWRKYLDMVIDAYGKDVENLSKRSKQKRFKSIEEENKKQALGYWPSVEYIRSRCMSGSHRAGIKVIGEGNKSEGSEFLKKLADEDDDRPIWVAAWGGANTLAQAIWTIQQTRSEAELKKFLHKFRVFTITDQDMKYDMRMDRAFSSHMWMRREFQEDLKFIWDEGGWQRFCDLGKDNWSTYKKDIQGHGALGKIYPNYKWGVEGDTPSLLYVMPNGLSNPEDPTQIGWSGYHTFGISPDSLTYAWNSWQEPNRSISVSAVEEYYPDMLNDFAARMQWAEKGEGNTNPQAIVNGHKGLSPLNITVRPGSTIILDASASKDSDGDKLSFHWKLQGENDLISIEDVNNAKTSVRVSPSSQNNTFHIVCEIRDNSPYKLVSYKRIIITVK